MALNDAKKAIEKQAVKLVGKGREAGGKAAETAVKMAHELSEKAQETRTEMLVKRYAPVFPGEYSKEGFDLPLTIAIDDEEERKGIEVCEGAMGWLDDKSGIRVLHLYHQHIALSGLRFNPVPMLGAVYYAHPFDKGQYVDLADYSDVMAAEKIAELRDVAYCLGAKRCFIEVLEERKAISTKAAKGGLKAKGKHSGQNATANASGSCRDSVTGEYKVAKKYEFTCEGDAEPVEPELRWFAHDKYLNGIISARCSEGRNTLTTERFELSASSKDALSVEAAGKIDAALGKLGADANLSVKGEVMNESRRKFRVELDF